MSELPGTERNDTDALLITLLLCDRCSVTARDVVPVVQRDVLATEDVLRRWAQGGTEILEPSAGTRGRRNPNCQLRSQELASLGPAVRYHRRNTDDVEVKITEHVREYESIDNKAVQRMFDVGVSQASAILRELVARDVLRRTTRQSRGTAVKYGRGPGFPELRRRR